MLPRDLLRPDAWPDPKPHDVELVETHVSWVMRGDREVIKVKKPVDLGFLDFRSPERRRQACLDEVRLNARLAPGVYLGVVPIVLRSDGTQAIGAAGDAAGGAAGGAAGEWAVRMNRLDDARRADAMLERGALAHEHVDALADAIADLHARAEVPVEVARRWASAPAVDTNVRENFAQTLETAAELAGPRVAREVEATQLGFVRDHQALFASRVDSGRVRDGHGDLRLEHAYFEDEGLRVIDCVEFDERYRVADVCADVAFLSMDLAAHGRVDLAERLLARYARAAHDYDLYALVDFYEGYRAWIRGKVAGILAHDAGASDEVRERAAAQARRHFLLAQASERPHLVPASLVCVGGIIASGKSTVAAAFADDVACPVVDADRTRKHLLGVAETRALDHPAWSGAYDRSMTDRVYAEILRAASVVLASGRSVVVEASFRSRAMRDAARRLARSRGVPFRFVECRAPVEECRARLARRPRGPSDARLAIFDDFVAQFEPVTELAPSEHVVLDTMRPLAASLDAMRARVVTWPRGLVA
jgi:aminoglycoside phosphotransferase family enzyme/predicted kinase